MLRMASIQRTLFACGVLIASFNVSNAWGFTFEMDGVSGALDSTVSVGLAMRTSNPSCGLVIEGATGPSAPVGCLALTSGLGDQGDLNYRKGQLFAEQIKGTHELLVKFPDDYTFMARANWVRDFAAARTTGIASASVASVPAGLPADNLAPDAKKDLMFKARMLDLWVSKSFQIGDQEARIRAGNQVINWGESLFLPGGINATNAVDLMRLSQPGTQIKEAVLPAPIVSFASGISGGFNVEAYLQGRFNENYFPPIGSFWSTSTALGKGGNAYGVTDIPANNSGQWGLSLRYQTTGVPVNFGLYALQYHDKGPQLTFKDFGQGMVELVYPENRRLYGVSANVGVGDWALGTELSYRPRDAIALNPNASQCADQNGNPGNCWVDGKRYQWHGTALLSLTPSGTGATLLNALNANAATLLAEVAVIKYPGLQQYYGTSPVDAGLNGWGQETNPNGTPIPVGTSVSSAFNFDFSWVYDGKIIPGWQVQPEIYYYRAISGRTPNASALFMAGAQSANFTVTFIQNPAHWQVALNYAKFWGGSSPFDQPLKDRDFLGAVVSRNF